MLKGRDLATFPLTPQFASKLARHLESCAACALSRGDRAFSAEQISEIPLAIPPGRLRLRISRTALAVGSYRRSLASRPEKQDKPRNGDQGNPPVPLRPRRGAPKAMLLSSVTLIALAVPTAILYRMAADSTHTPPAAAVKTVAASPSPTPAATTAVSPQVDGPARLQGHKHHRVRPPLPGVLTPSRLGELPVPLTGPGHAPKPLSSGSPAPGPGGSSAPRPSSSPATSSPTTPAPTPTPTTPAPTPTPTPTPSAASPTPSA
jgi:hypothetical protein